MRCCSVLFRIGLTEMDAGQSLEKIQRDTERDYFLSADEAKEYGLVDQVISKRS